MIDLLRLTKNLASNWLTQRPFELEWMLRLLRGPYADVVVFRELIHQGDTVLDIGANVGLYTSLFAHLVGPKGSVHAFEPVPPIFEQLEKNVTRSYVYPNKCAAGEIKGSVSMVVPKRDFSQAAMIRHSDKSWKGLLGSDILAFPECPVTTLDEYVLARGIEDVTLVKCDVEGAEMSVIRGARSLIRRSKPPMWFFECYAPWTLDFGYEPRDLFRLLESEGAYKIFHVGRAGLNLVQADGPVPGTFPNFLNFLAVVPSVHGDRVRKLIHP